MKKQIEEAIRIAKENGFTYAVYLDAATIQLMDEVRQMCSTNTCGMYNRNWACPPACGELSALREQVSSYQEGILVQTVGDIEDSLDFEAMMEIEAEHKQAFLKTAEELRSLSPRLLPLGSGCCTICRSCSYPDAPCRFPEKRISSMEAYGILVTDICKKNQLSYYYGSDKMAYTACFLLN